MLPEDDVVLDVDDVHNVFMIVLSQVLQDLKLDTCLIVIFLFILYYFDCYFSLLFVVKAAESCAERSFAQKFNDLIAISNMVSNDNFVISFVIIIAVIIQLRVIFLFFVLAKLFLFNTTFRLSTTFDFCARVCSGVTILVLINFLILRLS